MFDYKKMKLFNIKLIYVNRLFRARNFSDTEKKLAIEKIDREETKNGVEHIYFRLLFNGDRILDPIKPIKGIEKHKM